MNNERFTALVIHKDDDGIITRTIEKRSVEQLPPGDVFIEVHYSSLNYKDALSANGNRGVTRRYPHTPGIDAAGVVRHSSSNDFSPGDQVLCMGYDLGMNTPGGFGGLISVPADWVMPLPSGLSLFEAMQVGTAGFTAAQCVHRLVCDGVAPESGPVLVTGATGGVGSLAVRLLARLDYEVVCVTGKPEQEDYLLSVGAARIIERERFLAGGARLLLRERWSGVVDTVGGDLLATAVRACRYGGTVSCCGNAASGDLPLNVYPFILRAVTLAGIDSAQCPMSRRHEIWARLADDWRFQGLDSICRLVDLSGLVEQIDSMLAGTHTGRTVVDMRGACQ